MNHSVPGVNMRDLRTLKERLACCVCVLFFSRHEDTDQTEGQSFQKNDLRSVFDFISDKWSRTVSGASCGGLHAEQTTGRETVRKGKGRERSARQACRRSSASTRAALLKTQRSKSAKKWISSVADLDAIFTV